MQIIDEWPKTKNKKTKKQKIKGKKKKKKNAAKGTKKHQKHIDEGWTERQRHGMPIGHTEDETSGLASLLSLVSNWLEWLKNRERKWRWWYFLPLGVGGALWKRVVNAGLSLFLASSFRFTDAVW